MPYKTDTVSVEAANEGVIPLLIDKLADKAPEQTSVPVVPVVTPVPTPKWVAVLRPAVQAPKLTADTLLTFELETSQPTVERATATRAYPVYVLSEVA